MIKHGILAGITNLIIGFGISMLAGAIFPSINQEYMNESIFRPWDDPLMMAFFLQPFVVGFIFAYFWSLIKDKLKGSINARALGFAKTYFIVAIFAGMFATFTSFQLSLLIVLSWTIGGFLEALVAAYIFQKVK